MSARSIGGYSVAEVRTAGGDETLRFEAHLLLDGQVIAVVANGGEGGAHSYRPTEPSGRAALAVFERFATVWRGTDAGFEDGDALIYELLERWEVVRILRAQGHKPAADDVDRISRLLDGTLTVEAAYAEVDGELGGSQ